MRIAVQARNPGKSGKKPSIQKDLRLTSLEEEHCILKIMFLLWLKMGLKIFKRKPSDAEMRYEYGKFLHKKGELPSAYQQKKKALEKKKTKII